jgi:hypothetical protein
MSHVRELYSKNLKTQGIIIALFWGSLWGLAEATLGHILHLLRIPGLAGFVMFPVGLVFMLKAYKASNNLSVILSTSVVAATIKLSNILLPGTSPLDVFNPAIAIICESLAVFVLFFFIRQRVHQRHLILGWLVLSWRLLFVTFLIMMEALFPSQNLISLGFERLLSFFLWESVANGILIYLLMKKVGFETRSFPKPTVSQSVLASCLMFMAALLTEWIF